MNAIYCYVADAHWNTGLGHRTRFEALRVACERKGVILRQTGDPYTAEPCSIDAAGNLAIRASIPGGWDVLDGLVYALLRPQFARNRPPAPRPDWWPVVTCPPSTRALEAACLGFRVILTEPRNDGEYKLYQKLLAAQADPGLFNAVDGLGADRCADLLLASLNTDTPPGRTAATPHLTPTDGA